MTRKVRELAGWVTWDGDVDALRAVAGPWLDRVEGDTAVIRKAVGGEVRVRPGGVVTAWKGADGVVCFDPGAWETVTAGE